MSSAKKSIENKHSKDNARVAIAILQNSENTMENLRGKQSKMIYGLVMNVQKGMYVVKTEEGLMRCRLRGKLFNSQQTATNLVVVGDYVFIEHMHGDQGLIVEIQERRTKLSRKGVGSRERHLEQLIAANVDLAILVSAAKNPRYKTNTIDRYITAAEAGGIEPVICLNKIDLLTPADQEEFQTDVERYRRLGYIVMCTSTQTGEGIEEFRQVLKGKISVFTGSSGVGKSTLINALEGAEDLAKTGAVGFTTRKGRHTTTSAQIYELDFGAMIVDTPGMREFGLFDAEDGVKEFFADVEEIAARCKFNDCTHTHEPGCAVKRALEEGELDEQRYLSYLKLSHER